MTATFGSRRNLGLPTFRQVQRELDNLFDGALPMAARAEAELRGKASAPVALWEDGEHVVIEMELPGFSKEHVDVTIDKNVLTISAERTQDEGDRKYWHQERVYGKVERKFSLPETVATDSVDAELKDGVLTVRLSKRPETQPQRIAIRTRDEQAS